MIKVVKRSAEGCTLFIWYADHA